MSCFEKFEVLVVIPLDFKLLVELHFKIITNPITIGNELVYLNIITSENEHIFLKKPQC